MSLESIISSTHKEIAGSRTKNRLTVQISYAIHLIMDFYSTDFLVMMDYIEDISVISNPENPDSIHLYQVKTKSSDKQYLLSTVINDEWFQKLYANAQKYGSHLGSASVVCNTDIVFKGSEVFHNTKSELDNATIQSIVKKIRKAIAKDQGIDEKDVDLSKFYFVRSTLSTKGHKEEAEYKFQEFLLSQSPELQIAAAKSIYKLLYDELDKKFNNEISESCSDIQEIFTKKGLHSQDIKSLIACGLAVQIPELDKLYSEFSITSVQAKIKYSAAYRQIKMDMFSDSYAFVNLKRKASNLIAEACAEGIDSMPLLLEEVFRKLIADEEIPSVYIDEHYLKMVVMVLAYKYCYGGDCT